MEYAVTRFGTNAGVTTLDRTSSVRSVSNAQTAGDTPAVSRELRSLAERVHRDHPGVSLEVITELARDEHDQLARARVQTFRAILTERAVRRRVRSGRAGRR